MRAFVTGASGFIGIHLCKQLHDLGWQISALCRKKIDHPILNQIPIEWKQASLFEIDELANAMPNEPFYLFHLAASTTQFKKNHSEQTRTNVNGTANILAAVQRKPLIRMIHTSSIAAYGFHKSTIQDESKSLAQESDHNYSLTKWQSECLTKKATNEGLVDAVILNPANILGPYDTNNWIQAFYAVRDDKLNGVPPGGGCFAWAEEVAKAHITATQKGKKGENYLLGGPKASFLELTQEVQKHYKKKISKAATPAWLLTMIEPLYRIQGLLTGKEPLLTPDKLKLLTKPHYANDSKAQSELGYKHLDLSTMVERTILWIESK